jgi:choline kinase
MLNGDDIFRPSVLRELVRSDREIQAVISRKSRYDSDDSKVHTEGPHIVRISKELPDADINGEWIGMCAVRESGLPAYVGLLDQAIRDSAWREGPFYLPFYQLLIDSGQKLWHLEVESEAWAEIDYQMDLDYVRANLTRFVDEP